MKTLLTLLLVGMLCVTGWANTDAMLRGIRIVETQDQLHPPRGKLGERGPYQFRRSTWRMHTSSSFELAENREVANTVAKRHYAWIAAQLRAAGIEATPYNIAAAWNAGVNAVIQGRVPAVTRDYASRVLNLASTMPEPAPSEPVMVAEETASPKPEAPATTVIAAAPTPESPVVEPEAESKNTVPLEYVYTVPPSPSDPVQVRFHTNAITLAFSRPVSQETTKDAVPVQVALAANTALGEDPVQAAGRM